MTPKAPMLDPDRAPFLADAGAGRVIALLEAAGAQTRFVGGCVRDAVLGRQGSDIDLATTMPADRAMSVLREGGLEVVPTGLAHGTVTIVYDRRPIELTTLRRDVATDGRRAVVAFTDDWRADASRRDFTMNALYADRTGRVFDLVGGVEDARAGRVRFVGDAPARVREDYLRILRYFRFHAWYGRPPPDSEALAAVREGRGGLAGIARERVRQELLKLLAAPDPVPACRLMDEAGILAIVLAGPGDPEGLARLLLLRPEAGPVTRLAALAAPDADPEALAGTLRLSKAETRTLLTVRQLAAEMTALPSAAEARALAYRAGVEPVREAAALAEARGAAPGLAREVAQAVDGWTPPKLPVRGRDLRALGIPAGAEVGALLREIEAWWVARQFQPDRAACLARLRTHPAVTARRPGEDPTT